MKTTTAQSIVEGLFLIAAFVLLFSCSDSDAVELPKTLAQQTVTPQVLWYLWPQHAPPEPAQERREAQQVAEHMPSPLGRMVLPSVARNPQVGPRLVPSPRSARK